VWTNIDYSFIVSAYWKTFQCRKLVRRDDLEINNNNGMVETTNVILFTALCVTATAKRQRQNGNGTLETRHKTTPIKFSEFMIGRSRRIESYSKTQRSIVTDIQYDTILTKQHNIRPQ